MEYKDYVPSFTFDETLELFQGKVSNVHTLITFKGRSLEALRWSFQDAVNEHIAWRKNTVLNMKTLLLSFPETPLNTKGIYADLWSTSHATKCTNFSVCISAPLPPFLKEVEDNSLKSDSDHE